MFTALQRYASFLLHSPILIVLSVVTLQSLPTSPAQDDDIYLPLIRQQQPTATPTRLPSPGGTIPPARGIWLTEAEVRQLPTTGAAWDQLIEAAGETVGAPTLGDQASEANVIVLAKALVYARTGEQSYRDEVVAALRVITFDNTEDGGRTLALGRELAAYVIAADLINLPSVDADLHAQFSQKLRQLLTKSLAGWGSANHTLQETHELRANNWGTHAGASRAAVAFYLGDSAELERTALVFRGYLGDRSAYSGFEFADDLSWQADPANPVSVNPRGSIKEGHSIDGALPEEMRRGGSFQWPPAPTDYPWGGLQGALVQAEILHRAGYPAWEWEDQALKRAVQFLYDIGWVPEGNDRWMVWLVNHAYQTSFPTDAEVSPGTNMGWTNWTHP